MFGKFFASTFTGSMFGAGLNVFAVWGYVIANVRPDGLIEMNPRLLAGILGGQVEEIENAMAYLSSPDPLSRSKKNEGRRLIQEGPFLFSVPNYGDYRAMRHDGDRTDYMRNYMRDYRGGKQEKFTDVNKVSTDVNTEFTQVNSKQVNPLVNSCKPPLANAEAEAEAEASSFSEAEKEERAPEGFAGQPVGNPSTANGSAPVPNSSTANGSKNVSTRPTVSPKQPPSADDIIAKLAVNPAYSHIDVRNEYQKAFKWTVDHPRQPCTERFFKNWLKRIESPLVAPVPVKTFSGTQEEYDARDKERWERHHPGELYVKPPVKFDDEIVLRPEDGYFLAEN